MPVLARDWFQSCRTGRVHIRVYVVSSLTTCIVSPGRAELRPARLRLGLIGGPAASLSQPRLGVSDWCWRAWLTWRSEACPRTCRPLQRPSDLCIYETTDLMTCSPSPN